MRYHHLFSPLAVGGMTLRNRVMMTPMGTNYANPDGSMSPEHRRYYVLRAKGGTGFIVVENVNVDYPLGSNGTTQLRLDHDRYIPHLFELTESVHRYGGKIAVQINHAGASARSERIGQQPASASVYPSKTGGETPRPLTAEEIYEIVKKYGDAARRAQIAGFDAVEVHAGHSYLLCQFLSPTTNDRTDEFGGSAENRARFLGLVLREVRRQVGDGFPILLRVSAEEYVPGGLTLADTLELLSLVEEYVDIFDVSAGLNDSMENQIDAAYHPDGWRSYMSRAVREKFGKPVVSMGNYRDPKAAEAALERGDADIIGIGRGLIADPEWCSKARTGREEEIRKCISCCVGCAGNRIGLNRPIRCTVNPAVTEGDGYKNLRVKKPCRVVVVGGGTAGLEAACTAAEVGCRVTLLERRDRLGGRAERIARLPEKSRLMDFPDYQIRRAEKLPNLELRLNAAADPESIEALSPDILVVATGSVPAAPPIPGLREQLAAERVVTVDGLIESICAGAFPEDMEGRRAVVIGGGAVGLDVVEFFARRGAAVTVVEMLDAIGRDLDPVTRSSVRNLLPRYGVQVMTGTRLMEVRADSFVTIQGDEERILPFDYGVVCLGLKAENHLYAQLAEQFRERAAVLNIGDSLRSPGRIIDGVQQGRDILLTLEQGGWL